MDEYGTLNNGAQIKVVGVGGGGSNAVDRMIDAGVQGVEFVALNTDAQVLVKSTAPVRMRIGDKVTRGLGCGGDAGKGSKAAEESVEDIAEILRGSDMVFCDRRHGRWHRHRRRARGGADRPQAGRPDRGRGDQTLQFRGGRGACVRRWKGSRSSKSRSIP